MVSSSSSSGSSSASSSPQPLPVELDLQIDSDDALNQPMRDMASARAQSSLPITELTELLFGGPHSLAKHRRLMKLVDNDPIFDKTTWMHMSRQERFKNSLKMCKRLAELKFEHNLSDRNMFLLANLVDEACPLLLQFGMFSSAINNQTDQEQFDLWHEDTANMKLLGCYAQTELGHGSSLANLETTATLDKVKDEWIIHSPTLTSRKFWPGALGKFANTAIVYAQLTIDQRSYGPHGFLVPIRSLIDHQELPGIEILDIGPKVGYEGMDNGSIKFHHVRIPRRNMLMKFAKVDADGNYTKPPHAKLGYAVMTASRVDVILSSWAILGRAVVIALRYSSVRRQGPRAGRPEPRVIDYPLVQHRLFPLLAQTFALNAVGRWIKNFYHEMLNQSQNNNFDLLPELHATSSALKGYCTELSTQGVETARRCLGGHGYLKRSGIPDYFNSWVGALTYEGENGLLAQQLAKYLLKQYRKSQKGETISGTSRRTTQYLLLFSHPTSPYRWPANSHNTVIEVNGLVTLFGYRAYYQLQSMAHMSVQPGVTWDHLNVSCLRLAQAHTEYLLLLQLVADLENMSHHLSQTTIKVLTNLTSVFGLSSMLNQSGDFLESNAITSNQLNLARVALPALYAELSPHIIRLTDAFDISDQFLNSDLGSYDGNVYERILQSVKANPLNNERVVSGYTEYIKPIVTGKVRLQSKL